MLTIILPKGESYNESTNEFEYYDEVVLNLEHSLLSLSKWESKHQKPFLNQEQKSSQEIMDYVEAMILNDHPADVISRLTGENIKSINVYIESKESATFFNETRQPRGRSEVITSELIYYWMVAFQIPFECQTWHLNRLFALIRICGIKNSKPEKMSKSEMAARNRELNAQRRAATGTRG